MTDQSACVATFDDHQAAEAAVRQLQASGIDMRQLSIIGRDYHSEEHVVGYYNTGDRMKAWGKMGAFWGSLWGILFGAAVFIIPGIGPIAVAGPVVSAIVGGLEGAVVMGGVSALAAGLIGIGIPKDTVIKYETALKAGKFLLIVHGAHADTVRAKDVLHASGGHDEMDLHAAEATA